MKKLLIGLIVLCLLGVCPVVVQAKESLLVFAAASLSDALKELAGEFQQENQAKIFFNFAGSSALRLQIEKGGPCDIFLAADTASTEKLLTKHLLVPESAVNLLKNQLVIVAGLGHEEKFDSLYDLRLAAGEYIAIANPQTAPAGMYAMQALKNAGLDTKYKKNIVPTLDVRAALALVGSGNVKYAIVYFSDVHNINNVRVVYPIPRPLHEPIIYTAAIVKTGENSVMAQNFLAFLQTARSKKVFQKYGFQSF
ncbi:MAG: molybdate ABC transporter substrate-binding protein [Candidatus Omnitrophica bacterium]|nr:molybdate ABC transporter substrate-binding protein [Candidatus Omnitrophota bacterium]